MTAVEQLDYVEKYFASKRPAPKSIEDVYMAILCPAALGQPPDYVCYDREKGNPKNYEQNKGLDAGGPDGQGKGDGKITKFEAARPVRQKYVKGMGLMA